MSLSGQGFPVQPIIRNAIVNLWTNGESIRSVAKPFGITYQTTWNIVGHFEQTGSVDPLKRSNKRTSRTDDVVEYVEFLKSMKPSIYPNEMWRKLVENRVCLPQNVPSNVSVSRITSNDLGYSDKILRKVPAETYRSNIEENLLTYLEERYAKWM